MIRKISKNTKDTGEISKDFLATIKPNKKHATVVGLYGELGAGKTTFVQQVGKNLNIKRKLNSPTFLIMKRYLMKHKSFDNLFHIDAYRLKNEKELLHLGWEDIVSNPKNLVFIEWPERVIKAMPKKHPKICISHLPASNIKAKEGHRKFEIKNS